MIKTTLKSEISKDEIDISFFKKSHKSNLDIIMIDNLDQHIQLINNTIVDLKNNGIQWICIYLKTSPNIPENTLFFKHDKFNRICCHIEGFENFYLMNLSTLINHNNVYIESDIQKNGWTIVQNKKKPLVSKINNLKKEIANMITKMNI